MPGPKGQHPGPMASGARGQASGLEGSRLEEGFQDMCCSLLPIREFGVGGTNRSVPLVPTVPLVPLAERVARVAGATVVFRALRRNLHRFGV